MGKKQSSKRAINFIDLTGQRFGRWIVVSFYDSGRKVSHWNCVCDCGSMKAILGNNLRRGLTQSCGCYSTEVHTKHGKTKQSEYKTWHGARSRCTDPSNGQWSRYGGRGIMMCHRWLTSFENFFDDMGPRPHGMTLDRRDNDGPYSPENCRWATPLTQMRNRRVTVFATHDGETLPITEWAARTGIRYTTLLRRWKLGQPLLAPNQKSGEAFVTHDNETHSLREWSRLLGIPLSTLRSRRRRGSRLAL